LVISNNLNIAMKFLTSVTIVRFLSSSSSNNGKKTVIRSENSKNNHIWNPNFRYISVKSFILSKNLLFVNFWLFKNL